MYISSWVTYQRNIIYFLDGLLNRHKEGPNIFTNFLKSVMNVSIIGSG